MASAALPETKPLLEAGRGAGGGGGGGGAAVKSTWYLWFCVLVIDFEMSFVGYDVGIMGDALTYMEKDFDLDGAEAELIDGCLNYFAAVGALFGAALANGSLGRKGLLIVTAAAYLCGSVIVASAFSWQQIVVGRVVCGLANGLAFFCTVYLVELAPSSMRVAIVATYDISINAGITLGYSVGYWAETVANPIVSRWRLMMLVSLVLPTCVLAAAAFMPESPRWLVHNGRVKDARAVIHRLQEGPGVERVAADIISALEADLAAAETKDTRGWADFWAEVCHDRSRMRTTLLFVVGLGFLQQVTGSESILYYSDVFLESAGMTSLSAIALGSIIVGLSKIAGDFVPIILADTYGRRPFYIIGSVGTLVCEVLISLCLGLGGSGGMMVTLMCLFMFFFSVGPGPLLFSISTELLPYNWRGIGVSAVLVVNRLTSGTVASTTLSLVSGLGSTWAYFAFFSGFAAVNVAYVVLYLEEPKGATLEQSAPLLPPAGPTGGGITRQQQDLPKLRPLS